MKKLISMCIALALAACACTAAMAGSIDDDGHFTYDNSPHIHFQPSGEAFFITNNGGQDVGPMITVEDKYYIEQNEEGYWCYAQCAGYVVTCAEKETGDMETKAYSNYDPEQILKDFPKEKYYYIMCLPGFVASSNRYLIDPLPEKAWFFEGDEISNFAAYRELTEEERAATMKLIEKAHNITPGDINQDDKIDIKDALLALRISVKLEETPNEKAMPLVDMNKDNEVTVVDALYLLQISVGLRQA